jgi:hypothetical protein
MKGTLTIGGFVRGIFQTVAQTIVKTLADMAAQWIARKVAMLVFNKATALSEIGTAAAKAGAEGTASFAAAPWPINMGAPAFGAAMSAAALAYAPAASAAGGFDIPAYTNPVTQLHAREMVLPAKHADVIRSLADRGGLPGGGGGGEVNVQVRGHSMGEFLLLHKHDLVKALKSARRDMVF